MSGIINNMTHLMDKNMKEIFKDLKIKPYFTLVEHP